MKPITPHLWFDTQAREAARFYASVFPRSTVTSVVTLRDVPGPTGECDVVSFEVWGRPFMAISAEGEERPPIVPCLQFTGAVAGRAEAATDFYMSVFEGSRRGTLVRYGKGREPDREGTVMFTDFTLAGQWFVAADSAREHGYGFNEAVCLLIPCESQQEIDTFWSKLSADPRAEQCGWLEDRFGVSWQVSPARLGEMFAGGTREQVAAVTKAFLQMKKFDLDKLEKAFA